MKESLLSPEVRNYGEHMKTAGYNLGFEKCFNDARKRRRGRAKLIKKRFDHFFDWLDDKIAESKKH